MLPPGPRPLSSAARRARPAPRPPSSRYSAGTSPGPPRARAGAGRDQPAHLAQQALDVVGPLPQDALHVAVEPAPVVVGEVPGRQHDDRDVPPPVVPAHLGGEREPVHLRHQQVEHDQARRGAGAPRQQVERRAPVLGLDDGEPLPLQEPPQRPARRRVVLHHQDGARPRPAVAPASRAGARAARPVAAQDAQQPGAVDGLGEVLHGPQGEPQGLVVGDGEHHHRDVRQRGVGLERREHRPAVHPRHEHVQGDRVGARRAGQAQALLAPGGGEHPEALPGEGALQQVAHRRVVVDHQHRPRRAGGVHRARPLDPAPARAPARTPAPPGARPPAGGW